MIAAMIEGWNERLFVLLNGDGTSAHASLLLAGILADWGPIIAALALVFLWVRRGASTRVALLDATATALLGLIVAQVITLLWYHPRPFEMGLGHQFMPHSPEASFPSDHATLLFGLALPLLAAQVTRTWGWAFLALACATAWARVYLGVHFPFDMLGGLVLAACATASVFALRRSLHGGLYPRMIRLYENILNALRLPDTLFPRDL